eukprot:TRINITY_DN209_c0_g1_i19.p1 TRINITY_DN209_c0_g1~~TRINITY_DN209_c0_g1_i19.p1  ORF type:complete len:548 (+),score=116.22 TRINITY_DN209_c0_g1_i19:81-1724(+)
MMNGRFVALQFFGIMALVVTFTIYLSDPAMASQRPHRVANETDIPKANRIDDWIYKPSQNQEFGGRVPMMGRGGMANARNKAMPMMAAAPMAADSALGFSVGGAKGVSNFRENVLKGHLPLVSDVTYEGIFYDYFFDTGATQKCDKLFCPSYSLASSTDPINKKPILYMTVGLNSGLTEASFKRRPLNLMIVLDISGSMSAGFDKYYYSQATANRPILKNANTRPNEDATETETKLQLATKSLASMLDHLVPGDRLGVVLFDHEAYLAKPFRLVQETDMDSIKKHILEIHPAGATNMEAGMNMAISNFKEIADLPNHDNRIIFMTDAMPNTGSTGENDLLTITKNAAEKKIFTTFVGIGLDFQSELIEAISKVHGCSYFAVHNGKEFNERINEDFDLIVSPLVFDLKLKFQSSLFEIEKVYGSPEADQATGELMHVKTLFPSRTSEEGTRGGVVLLRLRQKNGVDRSASRDNEAVTLTVSFRDRDGKEGEDVSQIGAAKLLSLESDSYSNTGIRKAIMLVRYADMLKHWIAGEQSKRASNHHDGTLT